MAAPPSTASSRRSAARYSCSVATTCAPSPTAAATRLTECDRTSPMAKTPRRLVSRGSRPGLPSFETAARSLKVVPITAPVHSDAEIETAVIALGREPGGGLVVVPSAFTFAHRAAIILAAARHNVPAVYTVSEAARDGGLLSYGPDRVEGWHRAATYVDRILHGAKAGDVPVQFPTRFEMVVNLKTAKALGLTIPETLLATADEVIQ